MSLGARREAVLGLEEDAQHDLALVDDELGLRVGETGPAAAGVVDLDDLEVGAVQRR